MYKNAGIKSKEEAKQRLDAGETFWIKRWSHKEDKHEIKRDDSHIIKGRSPYRLHDVAIDAVWDHYADWMVKFDWFDNIPEQGVLCWVHDTEEEVPALAIVTNYDTHACYKFETKDNSYKYAIPATPEDTANLYIL